MGKARNTMGGRPDAVMQYLGNYSIWIAEKLAAGYSFTWLSKVLGVAQSSISKYVRILRDTDLPYLPASYASRAPETPIPNTEQPPYKHVIVHILKKMAQTPKRQSVELNGLTLTAPAQWDEITPTQLAELGDVARRATSVRGFLFYAAEVLYRVTIRELPKSRNPADNYISGRYIVTPTYYIPLAERHVVTATLGELAVLLDSLEWLLNHDKTRVESRRTRIPIDMPTEAELYPPCAYLADLTFNEFLVAEDLRMSDAPVSKFLAVLYAPHEDKSTLRVPFTARDFDDIERRLRDVLYHQEGGAHEQAWWWWWEGNLRVLREHFPSLFSNAQEEGESPRLQGRPSDLLYMLSGGDFVAFEAIKNTNLYEALRLVQERVTKIGGGR